MKLKEIVRKAILDNSTKEDLAMPSGNKTYSIPHYEIVR